MSTRAVLTIEDRTGLSFSIYTHSDGYPEGIALKMTEALQFAWPLPRFEAMDWAAAFVAANKPAGGGDVYLTTNSADHNDLDYVYRIGQAKNGQLIVECVSIIENKVLFYGRMKDFVRQYGNTYCKNLWNEMVASRNPLTVSSAA